MRWHHAEVHIDGGRTRFIDKDILEIIHNYKDSSSVHKINLVLEEFKGIFISIIFFL